MKSRIWLSTMVAAAVALSPTLGAQQGRWLHVRVQDGGKDGERVSVNVPLEFVANMLPLVESEELQEGKLHLDTGDLEEVDLREVLRALRDTPDSTFVTVQGPGESIRVAKEKDFLMIRADERGGGRSEKVRVRVPLAVIEARVSGGGEELDLAAGLQALSQYDGEDLVTVESEDSNVRIWIDSSVGGQ